MPDKRYAPQEDGEGRWFVRDLATDEVATVGDRSLASLNRDEAGDAVDLLNMVDHLRREKPCDSAEDYVQSVRGLLAPIGWSR